jgi:hypothetical protein
MKFYTENTRRLFLAFPKKWKHTMLWEKKINSLFELKLQENPKTLFLTDVTFVDIVGHFPDHG